MSLSTNRRYGPWDSLKGITDSIISLENTNVKCLWFESISSGTNGSFSAPTGGTILLNEWAEGVDVLVSAVDILPTFTPVFDTSGTQITGTLDVDGNWTISGAPDTGYPIALVYSYEVSLDDFSSNSCLESAHLILAPAVTTHFNGTIVETFDALVTATGGVVSLNLEKAGGSGGDLATVFSSGQRTFDCTPTATVTLTAGDDDGPTENYIYILETSPNTLTVDTSDWPSVEHIKVCYVLCPSAAYVENVGAYIVQNWNDHRTDTAQQGHLSHIGEAIRLTMDGAHWHSGIAGNGATSGYITIVTDDTPDSVYFKSTSGTVYQMHKHSVPAVDTSGANTIHTVNSPVAAYNEISDIGDEVLDSLGGSLSGRYYNIVMWGVVNKTGEYSPVMMNLPSGSYSSLSKALSDSLGYDIYDIPREFKQESTTGFLICRITLRHQVGGGGTFTVENTVDLRGRTPGTASGSAIGSPTTFADNQFELFNVTDNTKLVDFDLSGLTNASTRTITPADADMTLFSSTDYTDLTDGGESTLHFHNSLKDGGQVGAVYANAGALILNYNGVLAFKTTATGFSVFSAGGDVAINLEDSADALQSLIQTSSGDLFFDAGRATDLLDKNVSLRTWGAGGQENLILAQGGGAVSLYYDGTLKFATTAAGISVTDGTATAATLGFTSDDLYITNNDPGGLIIITAEKSATGQSTLFSGDPDGAVELHYAGAKTFGTISGGAQVTGVLNVIASDASASPHAFAVLSVEKNDHCGISILTPNNKNGYIFFGDPQAANSGSIIYSHTNNTLSFKASDILGLSIDPAGAVELYYAGEKTARTYANSFVITDGGTNAPGILYLGNNTTNGTWRFFVSGGDLLIQERESGTYNTKSTISGA